MPRTYPASIWVPIQKSSPYFSNTEKQSGGENHQSDLKSAIPIFPIPFQNLVKTTKVRTIVFSPNESHHRLAS
jgi:hypothetical protein